MRKVWLRRKENTLDHLPEAVRIGAKVRLGSVFAGRQPLKGVDGEEAKKLFEGILPVDRDHQDWPHYVNRYWIELSVKVPFEGTELEVGKDENDKPYNVDDYLTYRFCLKHPHCGNSKAELVSNNRFYLHDPKKDEVQKAKVVRLRKDADKEYIKASSDEKTMDRLIRLLSASKPDNMNLDQKETFLYELKGKEPAKFIKAARDKHLELKAEIEEMVSAGVLRKIGNQVIFIDEVIGETTEDTIVYMKDKKNSGTLTTLRAKLKEVVI
tara:strand:+ start:24547 stop:25350 length:804 start_codon:yes stop_codon:yes gene_type:complete